MLGGIQDGCSFMGQLSGSFRLNAGNLPFDSSSASSAPVLEHRVIFCGDWAADGGGDGADGCDQG